MGTRETKVAKHLSYKYNQKRLDSAEKSTTDAKKTASKKAIQKSSEATGDFIGNEIADKKTSHTIELDSKINSEADENEL